MIFTDKANVEVAPGDLIIYGHALGRCAGIRFGKVLALAEHPKSEWGSNHKTGDRDCKLRIIGVDDDWSHEEPKLLSKASVIAFGSRVLKLHPDQVPKLLADLLNTYESK
ncbi:MAG: hypothetical protein KBD06_01440 [Candidatus Pacebacteria bacterium]|nr:hypothetical protein [Candidatus Paceibacterota bacterium]